MLEIIKKLIPRKIFKFLSPLYHFVFSGLAALWYRFPSRKLIVIGVTGTAGKTSTVYLIAKTLEAAGYKTGFTSTAVFNGGAGECLNDKKMTMPGRFFIQRFLRQMVKNRCCYAVIETSSEGIKQFRHRFINYDTLVFTGLYPEHIEAHGSFAKYRETKGKLFAHLKRGRVKYINEARQVIEPRSQLKKLDLQRVLKTLVINGDDDNAEYFGNFWSEAKIVYSFNPAATNDFFLKKLNSEYPVKDFTVVKGTMIEADTAGTTFLADGEKIHLKLLGSFNSQNALAAYAVGFNQNLPVVRIKSGLEEINNLTGKMELIDCGQNFTVIIDYSFEPRALEKLYSTVKLFPYNKIIHLLGSAGGGRDKARRPLLGKLAAEQADFIIITNEDPYDEDPAAIINQVSAGAEMFGAQLNKNLFKILDRREAIKKALMLAEEGDLVLFTGKGAEQSICLEKGRKLPWDEREVVKEAIVDKMCIDKK
ncbi:MAG: UDP-N-acetylmuramyl-tripeptide synthetase [Patescibacteria group bacterium]